MANVLGTSSDFRNPPPTFTLSDAEEVVQELAPAVREFSEWVRDVHAVLVCRLQKKAAILANMRADDTKLGRWFNAEPHAFLANQSSFEVARRHYGDVQYLAHDLCKAVKDERSISVAEYSAFAKSIEHFDASMEALIRHVWEVLRFTDPLTGISTRQGLLPRLREEWERSQRTGQPCCVCMVDLDHFKRINDVFGHGVGDQVLAAVSALLARSLRSHDQICRYGGEEFVLLLPNTDAAEALPVVNRLRHGIASMGIDIGHGVPLRITASFGIAPLMVDRPIQDSIALADHAMYEAKRAGRDRVHVWRSKSSLTLADARLSVPRADDDRDEDDETPDA